MGHGSTSANLGAPRSDLSQHHWFARKQAVSLGDQRQRWEFEQRERGTGGGNSLPRARPNLSLLAAIYSPLRRGARGERRGMRSVASRNARIHHRSLRESGQVKKGNDYRWTSPGLMSYSLLCRGTSGDRRIERVEVP
jgi:hypothetical protein